MAGEPDSLLPGQLSAPQLSSGEQGRWDWRCHQAVRQWVPWPRAERQEPVLICGMPVRGHDTRLPAWG